mmetsp:Transcript_55494/g.119787  ORF Transcript_55494/g.119787 Transcript_55494/m.119787 type:complete len:182 (+) Transcript_55494:239-784(+)
MTAPGYRNPQYYHYNVAQAKEDPHEAQYKTCHYAKSRLVHCVVACLVRGGKVITPGLAMCSEGSPRLRPHVSRLLHGFQPKTMTQHAEIAALNRLPEGVTLRQLRQTTLVVIRPKYSQKLGRTRMLCAQPCRECAEVIFRLGIKAVVYSSEDALLRRFPAELLGESLPSSGTEWLMRKKPS